MATGSLTVAANVSGGPDGARTFGPLSTLISAAVAADNQVALSTGNNTILVPAGVTICIIVGPNVGTPQPNPAYGGVLTLKGAAGDAGVVISAYAFHVLNWVGAGGVPAPPASFVINASIGATSVLVWMA